MNRDSNQGGANTLPGENPAQLDELVDKIYHELRHIARAHSRDGHWDPTLQTTALVHEAYLRMASSDSEISLQDRQHLKSLTSRVIRQVMVDYARRSGAAKRDPRSAPPSRIEETLIEPKLDVDVLDLDAALHQLAGFSRRLEQIVECRFFGGMSVEETASALSLSTRTVERDWRKAKTYLLRILHETKPGGKA